MASAAAGTLPVRMPVVTVVAVPTPAGQPLQGGPGGLPVTTAAGRLAAGVGVQQPAGVDPMAGGGPDGRPLLAVAAAIGARGPAVASQLPAGRVGLLHRLSGGWCSGPPVPRHPAPAMLRRPWVVEAVGAPVAVQFRRGHAPDGPLAWVGGDGAELS